MIICATYGSSRAMEPAGENVRSESVQGHVAGLIHSVMATFNWRATTLSKACDRIGDVPV
jgi:hypothetical protein